jgi:hypothetical protein
MTERASSMRKHRCITAWHSFRSTAYDLSRRPTLTTSPSSSHTQESAQQHFNSATYIQPPHFLRVLEHERGAARAVEVRRVRLARHRDRRERRREAHVRGALGQHDRSVRTWSEPLISVVCPLTRALSVLWKHTLWHELPMAISPGFHSWFLLQLLVFLYSLYTV